MYSSYVRILQGSLKQFNSLSIFLKGCKKVFNVKRTDKYRYQTAQRLIQEFEKCRDKWQKLLIHLKAPKIRSRRVKISFRQSISKRGT